MEKKEEKMVKDLQLGQIYTIGQIEKFLSAHNVTILSEDISNFNENLEEKLVVTKVFEAYIHDNEATKAVEQRKIYIANKVV